MNWWEWVFSGIGVFIIGLLGQRWLKSSERRASLTAQGARVSGSPVASGTGITQTITETHHHNYPQPAGEPFQSDSKNDQMREQLYREIANNFHNVVVRVAVVTSIPGIREGALFRFNEKLDISFGVWNFYNDEKRRESLFNLKEAGAICRIYEKFTAIVNDGPSGYAHVRGKEAAAEVDDRLLDGTLDRELYLNVCSPEARKFANELLTGKRESYRKFLNPL
jgi:hypothetical protein